jgi:pimeloyl-ACP methyl ester carboxylesterase
VERRDYGISGSGARPSTFARQAEDIAAVLGALGEPSYVFGHSCGGLAGRAGGMVADLECMTAMPAGPDSWPAVTMPVLLLAGEQSDGYGQRSVAMLRESLPVRDTIILAGQGHHPDDPEPVAAALHAFFTPRART